MSPKRVDPARSLNLLWGSQTTAGRSGLTVKQIVTAGMEIADAEGIEAVSMRNVADRLGAGTMSLYTHVPGKSELLDLMLDAAFAHLYDSVSSPSEQGADWRDGLRYIAKRNWELYQKHPWMLDLSGGRPVLGPHVSLKYEAELRVLDGIGLTDVEMDATLSLVLMHVESCARLKVNMEATQRATGMDETEWWLAHAPVLERLIDPAQFPVGTRVGAAAGEANQGPNNPELAYGFGLERIIAGVSMLIATGEGKAARL